MMFLRTAQGATAAAEGAEAGANLTSDRLSALLLPGLSETAPVIRGSLLQRQANPVHWPHRTAKPPVHPTSGPRVRVRLAVLFGARSRGADGTPAVGAWCRLRVAANSAACFRSSIEHPHTH